MNLRDSTREQLVDVIEFLREEAESESAPAPLIWQERRVAMLDVATFLEAFIIPRIPTELGTRHAPDGSGSGTGNGTKPLEVLRGSGFGAQLAPAVMTEEGEA